MSLNTLIKEIACNARGYTERKLSPVYSQYYEKYIVDGIVRSYEPTFEGMKPSLKSRLNIKDSTFEYLDTLFTEKATYSFIFFILPASSAAFFDAILGDKHLKLSVIDKIKLTAVLQHVILRYLFTA